MSFSDREQAFEAKFSMDKQKEFKIEARACRLIAKWAAEQLGLSGEDADKYAKEVIISNLDEPGYDDVKRKLVQDFANKKIGVAESEIDNAIQKAITESHAQIEGEGTKK
ncbi:MAG: DUF1476 domain-containing protein [Pseudobdellovibrionaceae bacterium]